MYYCVVLRYVAALRMFGYSKRDMIGQNINEIIPEPISTVHQQYLSLYVRTGHEVRRVFDVCTVVRPSCLLASITESCCFQFMSQQRTTSMN
jgi:hypothetical protein